MRWKRNPSTTVACVPGNILMRKTWDNTRYAKSRRASDVGLEMFFVVATGLIDDVHYVDVLSSDCTIIRWNFNPKATLECWFHEPWYVMVNS